MATKNFTEFNTATPLTTSDYIVGYKADGTAEIKTQVQSILNLKNDLDAQTLSFNEGNKNLSISNGNTVSLSALIDSNINFLPLSGGTVTGNLSVLGNITYLDTNVQVTSAMFIDTTSSESALRITQNGTGNAILVEDSTNPDSAPFLIDQVGTLVVGATAGLGTLTASQRAGLFVANHSNGKNIFEIRNHFIGNPGTVLRFNKTRTGEINNYSTTTTPLCVLDNLGSIQFSGNNQLGGSISVRCKYDVPVGGTLQGTDMLFQTVSGTVLTLNEDKVGINTQTPNERLTVVGNISASQSLWAQSISLTNATVTEGQALTSSLSSLVININGQNYKIPLLPV